MADYINRNDAIKTYCDGCPLFEKCVSDGIECSFMQRFKRIPAANVRENVRGRWLNRYGDEVHLDSIGRSQVESYCSVCGDFLSASDEYSCRGYFCPNCGADMKGEQ